MDAADADLIELAKKELAKIGLAAEDDVVDGCVVRQPKAYPVYDDDYATHVDDDPRASWRAAYPTLHLVGRNGMHKYNNQDHAMMTAMLTVEEHPGGRARLRRLERQPGRRVPRSRQGRCSRGAGQRAPRAATRRRCVR